MNDDRQNSQDVHELEMYKWLSQLDNSDGSDDQKCREIRDTAKSKNWDEKELRRKASKVLGRDPCVPEAKEIGTSLGPAARTFTLLTWLNGDVRTVCRVKCLATGLQYVARIRGVTEFGATARFEHALVPQVVYFPKVVIKNAKNGIEHEGSALLREWEAGSQALSRFLERQGERRFPRNQRYWQWVARTVRDIADALDAAHSKRVYHRDINPSNLLLVNGEIRVIDFGEARSPIVHDAIGTDWRIGTEGYMSGKARERLCKTDQDWIEADIYSIGAVLFELMTNRPLHAELANFREGDYPQPLAFIPQAPQQLSEIYRRCVRHGQGPYLNTCDALRTACEQFIVIDRKPRIIPRARRVIFPWLISASAMTCLLLIAYSWHVTFGKERLDSLTQLRDAAVYYNGAEQYFDGGLIDEAKRCVNKSIKLHDGLSPSLIDLEVSKYTMAESLGVSYLLLSQITGLRNDYHSSWEAARSAEKAFKSVPPALQSKDYRSHLVTLYYQLGHGCHKVPTSDVKKRHEILRQYFDKMRIEYARIRHATPVDTTRLFWGCLTWWALEEDRAIRHSIIETLKPECDRFGAEFTFTASEIQRSYRTLSKHAFLPTPIIDSLLLSDNAKRRLISGEADQPIKQLQEAVDQLAKVEGAIVIDELGTVAEELAEAYSDLERGFRNAKKPTERREFSRKALNAFEAIPVDRRGIAYDSRVLIACWNGGLAEADADWRGCRAALENYKHGVSVFRRIGNPDDEDRQVAIYCLMECANFETDADARELLLEEAKKLLGEVKTPVIMGDKSELRAGSIDEIRESPNVIPAFKE